MQLKLQQASDESHISERRQSWLE